MRQLQCLHTTYVFSMNEFFIIIFFETNPQPLSFIQRNEHVEMNNFSCSLSCTWVTIIDCLFYASDSLSRDAHGSILLDAPVSVNYAIFLQSQHLIPIRPHTLSGLFSSSL